MQRALAAATLILAGCGSVATGQPAAPAPGAGALHCSLPVVTTASAGAALVPGFVRFPSGRLELVSSLSFLPNQLHGLGPSYDQAFSTWVPVPLAGISPDGSRYAYSQPVWNATAPPTTRIHVVDVRSGQDRDVYDRSAYDVAAFGTDGVYLVHHLPGTDASNGLWLLNPDTGKIRVITTTGLDWQVGGGAGWSADLRPGDTAPGKLPADRLLHLDLATGSATPWFTRPGFQVQVFGFDTAGNPMIVAGSPATLELWQVTGPNASILVNREPGWNSGQGIGYPVVADDHGVWLSTPGGVFLYHPDSTILELVFTQSAGAKLSLIAGACA